MKKIVPFVIACLFGIANVDAAVRDANTVVRPQTQNTDQTTAVIARTTRTPNQTSNGTIAMRGTTARNTAQNTITRPTTSNTNSRTSSNTDSSGQSRSATVARTATGAAIRQNNSSARNTSNNTIVRNSTSRDTSGTVARTARASSARATTIAPSSVTNTFGTEYNQCRNAYFTCMDQFCATANDTYRRCVCSSRLTDIQERERALSQASDQIQDFTDLNIEVIPKTAAEVNAMLNASEGELAITEDKSDSAQQLAGIREVLSSSKSQSLSTLGTLDIAGDINQIWATTDLASGQNISNLTGEALYNAVHAQCVNLVSAQCPSQSTLNMVVSAYGMYIENDCSLLMNALDSQLVQANSTIRETERNMNQARLENYNAHNSTSINDCIAQVRADITADTACGTDYVHCLDITGRYLNRDTGEPIYSRDFYQLGNQISLDGDVLKNASNTMIVSELNKKRIYAERGLETCRDIADEVWDEFMRQAIVEIYQGQQGKIRDVKNECLDVVNQCYNEQSESLKDFSNAQEELLLGSRLELSEELCQEKLYACSNLYGDPNGDGLDLLLTAMHDLTDQKLEAQCQTLLEAFAQDMCTVPSNDNLHSYPYGCRVYAPGDAIYASNWWCNQKQWEELPDTGQSPDIPTETRGYVCTESRMYTSCNPGYYMAIQQTSNTWIYNGTPTAGNRCLQCPTDSLCPGGTNPPQGGESGVETDTDCGEDYAGSLYQKMVKYATQVCVRPSEYDAIISGAAGAKIPETVLQDVNIVMDSIRVDMANALSAECERLGGTWVSTQWIDNNGNDEKHDKTGQKLFKLFYDETGSNTKWGFCAEPDQTFIQGIISAQITQ